MEPRLLRDVDPRREAGPVVDLPVAAGVENRRVLDRVGITRLVRAKIDLLGVGAVPLDPELHPEEAAPGASGDVHVDDAVAHLEVVDDRRSAVETETLAAEVLRRLRLSLKLPARRIRGERDDAGRVRRGRRREATRTEDRAENSQGSSSRHGFPQSIVPGGAGPRGGARAVCTGPIRPATRTCRNSRSRGRTPCARGRNGISRVGAAVQAPRSTPSCVRSSGRTRARG
jgi:hypothetical protein